MVKLSLSSTKGTGTRSFPHAGYLALTPIKLEGVVRTRLDDDAKPLLASDLFVAVRCYEARVGRAGITHSNLLVDHHLLLWSKSPTDAWTELGDGDWPFRLVLQPTLAGHSTANFQEYRVFWRIEAVLNHIPMTGVGHRQVKTYDLPLTRYDPGEPLPAHPVAWSRAGRRAALRYVVNTPPFPLGPMDLVPVALKLHPSDPATRVHSVALAVERRLEFNSLAHRPADDTSLSSTAHLVDRAPPSKTNIFIVASAEANRLLRDDDGMYSRTVTLQIPAQKSSSHWAVGETMRTPLVTLRFILRIKVTLALSQPGTFETVELEERELRIVACNESQRRLAMAKYTEAVDRARARAQEARLPSPPPSPTEGGAAGPTHGKTAGKGKGVRRPHTSAGPRDVAREAARTVARRPGPANARARGGAPGALEPGRGWEEEVGRWQSAVDKSPSSSSSPPPPSTVRSAPSTRSCFAVSSASASSSSTSVEVPPPAPETVQAWEEELERIAAQSRRRSVEMLGFSGERRTRPRIEMLLRGQRG